ncbi:hypothetical protein Tco_1251476 [Tanacetum coccineum]
MVPYPFVFRVVVFRFLFDELAGLEPFVATCPTEQLGYLARNFWLESSVVTMLIPHIAHYIKLRFQQARAVSMLLNYTPIGIDLRTMYSYIDVWSGRIKKDLLDPEKLEATLGDESLAKGSDLKKPLEMVALFEAQLKEMNPIQNYQRIWGLNLRQVQLLHQQQKQMLRLF